MPPAIAAIRLPKHLKHMRQKTRIDSLSCILNNKRRVITLVEQGNLDATTGRRKFHGIIQNVPRYLL
jgi:hypothetical protein